MCCDYSNHLCLNEYGLPSVCPHHSLRGFLPLPSLSLNPRSASTASPTSAARRPGPKSEYETSNSSVTPATCESKVRNRSGSRDFHFSFKLNCDGPSLFLVGQPTSMWSRRAAADRRGDYMWQQPMNFKVEAIAIISRTSGVFNCTDEIEISKEVIYFYHIVWRIITVQMLHIPCLYIFYYFFFFTF